MTAELRGRGKTWKVWYSDESDIPTPVPVYDREGILKEVLQVGAPSGKLVEAHFEGPLDEARAFAMSLGETEITVKRTATRSESLARARKARAKSRIVFDGFTEEQEAAIVEKL